MRMPLVPRRPACWPRALEGNRAGRNGPGQRAAAKHWHGRQRDDVQGREGVRIVRGGGTHPPLSIATGTK